MLVFSILRDGRLREFKQKHKRKSVSMIKRKKQLLGAFGLGIALVTLAFGCIVPSQIDSAHATDIDINVTIQGPGSSVTIITPKDGAVVTDNVLSVTTSYSKISSLRHTLVCMKDGAQVVNEVVSDITSIDPATNGRESFDKSLAAYDLGTASDCTLKAIAVTANGGSTEDTVTFRYRALHVVMNDGVDVKGNPSATISANDQVTLVVAQVYDEQGNPVFVKDGVQTDISIPSSMFDSNRQYILNLPMSEYGAKAGKYSLVVLAYNSAGSNISQNTVEFNYVPKSVGPTDPDDPDNPDNPDNPDKPTNPDKPGVPEVPGTGSILGDMNIARFDYILAGLIAFGAVAGFAVYLMARARRREK